jgi:hypothetical protein
MRFIYGDPRNEDHVDGFFQVMYHEDCIDAIPDELRRPSYFADAIFGWREGCEHVWFVEDGGIFIGMVRAELYGESLFIPHVCATKEARGLPIVELSRFAMNKLKEIHGKCELLCVIKDGNERAHAFCRMFGWKKSDKQEEEGSTIYERCL